MNIIMNVDMASFAVLHENSIIQKKNKLIVQKGPSVQMAKIEEQFFYLPHVLHETFDN